jgi:hypothetical protein
MGPAASFFMGLAFIVIAPIATALFSFVSGAILYIIWKLMGSQEPFETAFRCGAYAAAISPLTTLLGVIPYLGSLLGLGWMTYLLGQPALKCTTLWPKRPGWSLASSLRCLPFPAFLHRSPPAGQRTTLTSSRSP